MKNPESPTSPRLHPETGRYHIDYMPQAPDEGLRATREKQLRGEPLSIQESMRAGRDTTVNRIGDYELKSDHAYRAVGREGLDAYMASGYVYGAGGPEVEDEFEEGVNNNGVDWYLGAVALRYGSIILETPADPLHFEPAAQNGRALAKDPTVLHMKSSGSWRPIPMSKVRVLETNK
ncbi:MAG: hypothetical protein JWN75_581 [Candidatus Saccharibacteria bacterium]|nr:hypothetical protein [Candidatus Saccharibacteria bacterium]